MKARPEAMEARSGVIGCIYFSEPIKKNNWGLPLTLYDFQQLGHGMSKLGFEK
jgi:hypothetical protein